MRGNGLLSVFQDALGAMDKALTTERASKINIQDEAFQYQASHERQNMWEDFFEQPYRVTHAEQEFSHPPERIKKQF